VRWAWG